MFKTWKAHINGTFSLAFDPVNGILASGGGDNLVKIWDSSLWDIGSKTTAFLSKISTFVKLAGGFYKFEYFSLKSNLI